MPNQASRFDQQVPFPEIWDNTMVATGVDCPKKLQYAFFHHLQPGKKSVDLHAGASFAKGIEVVRRAYYDNSVPSEQAIQLGAKALIIAYGDYDPGDSVKTCERMVGALASYFQQYPPETDHLKPLKTGDKSAIEFSFALPIDVLHPVTGQSIIYCGRFDMLATLNDNASALFVADEKTTKQLGPSWAKQWNLRSQFMGYAWGSRKYDYPVQGAIIRGVSILKEKFGHAESIVYFPQWKIDKWYEQLCRNIERFKKMWEENYFDYSFAGECSTYGGCKYTLLCDTDNPEQWVDGYFHIRVWEPLKIREGGE